MIQFLSRDQWGAGPLRSGHVVPVAQFVGVVVHHTVIVLPDYDHDGMTAGDLNDCIEYMRQLQHARPDLGDEVPYSFVVFEGVTADDCVVAEGRGLGVTGAHTIGYNSTRYGAAFAGDFTNRAPTPGMWAGVGAVGRMLVDYGNAQPTIEHRDVYATQCPGNSTETPAPALAQPPFQSPHPSPPDPVQEDDDMLSELVRFVHDPPDGSEEEKTDYLLTGDGLGFRKVTSEADRDFLRLRGVVKKVPGTADDVSVQPWERKDQALAGRNFDKIG